MRKMRLKNVIIQNSRCDTLQMFYVSQHGPALCPLWKGTKLTRDSPNTYIINSPYTNLLLHQQRIETNDLP